MGPRLENKTLWLVFLLLLCTPLASAVGVNITINEAGKVVSFYDQYYIYQIDGNVTISNPYNSSMYNVEIPLYLSTLYLQSNMTGSDYISPHGIYIQNIPAATTKKIGYRILGITTENFATKDSTVLGSAIERMEPHIYSSLLGTLMKGPMEDSSITGRNARVLTVELRNPTGLTYTVEKLDVIKTPDMDPNNELRKWSFGDDIHSLDGYETHYFDFMDDNATEGEVYWLSSDVFIEEIDISHKANISKYDQEDLFLLEANATLNETVDNETLDFLADRIYLSKSVSSTLMVPGQEINVTILVNNFEPEPATITLTDYVPEGFEILSVKEGTATGNNVSWTALLSSGTAKRFTYTLRYTDSELLGVDYFKPATLSYHDNTYYSQTISFVRKYVPEKRIFVQKNVKFLSGDEVQVTLSVQNLGETSLQNVMVKEHLLSSAEFREISMAPVERGLWRIDSLNQSTTWTTSYVTDRESVMNTLPDIYGVPKASVLQTIILSNLVTSTFSAVSTSMMEIFGVVILGILIILYFLPANFFSRTRKRQKKDLSLLAHEISNLREKTIKKDEPEPIKDTLPVAKPPAQENTSRLSSPERQARHSALEDTAEQLEAVKKGLQNKDDKD